jgi:hypothetical protein
MLVRIAYSSYGVYCKSRERCNVAHRIIVENLRLLRGFDKVVSCLRKNVEFVPKGL